MYKKSLLIGALVIASVLGYYFYQYNKVINVKYTSKNYLQYPFWVAEGKDLYNKNRLRIENATPPKTAKTDSEEAGKEFRNWLAEGGADVAVFSTDEFLKMEIEHPDSVKAFAFFYDTKEKFSNSIIVGKNSAITKATELEGKKIGTDFADIDTYILENYLNKASIDASSMKVASDKGTKAGWQEMISNNKVDAILAREPVVSQLLSENIGRVLVANPNNEVQTEISGAVTDVLVFRTDFIKNNKWAASRFEKVIEEALGAEESVVRSSIKSKDNLSDETINRRTFAAWAITKNVDRNLLQKVADGLAEKGFLSKKADVNKLIY